MQIVQIKGPKSAILTDVEDPHAHGEFVVVRIEIAPMCTEYKAWKNGWLSTGLGHEAAGTVEATDGIRKVKVGERVVVMPQSPCGKCRLCLTGNYVYCQGSSDPLAITGNEFGTATYAEKMIKQDWLLVPIPDDISTEHASMANCGLGPSYGAFERLCFQGGETVLVTGLGPVGLGAIVVAKSRGHRVIAVEGGEYRASLGRELGAETVLNPNDPDVLTQILGLTNGLGVDAALECAGVPASQRLAVDAVRRLGSVAFVAEASEFTLHVSNDLIRKGLNVVGSWYYNLGDTVPLMNLIRKVSGQLDLLITHQFPLAECESAFHLQEQGLCGKVLLTGA